MLINILLWILVGAVAGWVAGIIMRSNGSLIRNIILGIVGAVAGGFIVKLFGIDIATFSWQGLLVAIGGACLLILIFRILFGRK